METIKTTCLINNFNYKDYVCEAIESALSQTHPFDEIIIVDDASTDGSIATLYKLYGENTNVKIIIHDQNQGQLGTVTTGFLHSTGDIIFFLDSDDFYHPQYLEMALNIYKEYPSYGFLHCQMGIFNTSKNNYQPPSQTQISNYKNYLRDCGYSIVLAMEKHRFVGSPTSGNSICRKHLEEILPCTCVDNNRMYADLCFVFASSLLGVKKLLINLPLVGYRMHGKNDSKTKANVDFTFYEQQIALSRLITFYSNKMNYSELQLIRFAPFEFKTADPTWNLFFDYLMIMLQSSLSVPSSSRWQWSKFHGLKIMLKHMLTRHKHSDL